MQLICRNDMSSWKKRLTPTTQHSTDQLHAIYYYLTFTCNLRCAHCYVGGHISPESHADADAVLRNLAAGHARGAREVVLLGGEPTLHPEYARIVVDSVAMGYTRLVVDTNGSARSPLVDDSRAAAALTVRLSFEGIDTATHDRTRGKGVFDKALSCLRAVRAAGIRTEVTFTIHAGNYKHLSTVVDFFASEQIAELNFHFVSLMGNAAAVPTLALSGEMILAAQEQLDRLKALGRVPLRYPRLLVRDMEWQNELAKGLFCRLERNGILLIFPNERTCRCPLEIPAAFDGYDGIGRALASGCPLIHRLLPRGAPTGYRATCVSWK
jgi:MoaA/NifB/PqqE/SkfB family radical SAM enzyme